MKSFEYSADIWYLKNRNLIEKTSNFFNKVIHNNSWIEVQMYVYIETSKLFTKKDKLKKIDVSNRIKATHDKLSDILNIDDKYFSVGKSQFIASHKNSIDIVLIADKIKTEDDIRNEVQSLEANILLNKI